MTDAELVYHETYIPLADVPEGLRSLMVEFCKLSMGELLVLAERAEVRDAKKGAMVRRVWEQRRDAAALRSLRQRG